MGEKVGEDGREGWSRWWRRLEEMGEKVGVFMPIYVSPIECRIQLSTIY